jgi:RNA-directed DNA polymerase
LRKFELALHSDKIRLIRFGRHAAKQREKLGEGKAETFDFLGFTHFCTRSRKWGSFVIGRKTIKKRMRAKLLAIKIELRRTMHDPIAGYFREVQHVAIENDGSRRKPGLG